MSNPKISIIIPTYNRAELLIRALESVLLQTYKNFEILVMDDGSTDNTKKIIEEYQKKDKRIKYFWQKNSGSPVFPRNEGIKKAQGEFIALLDSDDEWLSNKLEEQIKLFKNDNRKLGFVACDLIKINSKTKREKKIKIKLYKNNFEELLKRNFITGSSSTLMIKKDVFEKVGLFNKKIYLLEDWEMWIRIAREYKLDNVNKYLCKCYEHGENRGGKNKEVLKGKSKDLEYLYKKYQNYYEKKPKIYSDLLRYDGTRNILAGQLKKGKARFLESIKKNPFNLKSYLYLILSFLGKNFYNSLAQVKRFIKK